MKTKTKTKTEKSFIRKLIECWVAIIIIVWLMISLLNVAIKEMSEPTKGRGVSCEE